MKVNCNDRDCIFEDGASNDWAALEAHAATCEECSKEIRAWKALSEAARELRDDSESPTLWPRIERALSEQASVGTRRAERWGWLTWSNYPLGWQTALAGALVLVLSVSAGWFLLHRSTPERSDDHSLLKSAALAEVERAESAYVQAIEKLAAEAKPQFDANPTPLQSSYHEKLLVLDSAISDLRAQAGLNPSNAHIRNQLLAMYQEKQRTLQEILEEKR